MKGYIMRDQFLWVEKYRPTTVEQTILPAHLKKRFQAFVDQKQVPNLLLTGSPGLGKTTIARAMLEQLGCTYILINGSLEGNIDTLRNDIRQFASTMSFDGTRKYVILDEADYLNPNTTQPALRGFMEEFASNCGFILTCNHANRIIPAISESRLAVVDFTINKANQTLLSAQFFKRVTEILNVEKVPFDPAAVVSVINKYVTTGGWRRILTELQQYSATGKIDVGVLYSAADTVIAELVKMIEQKDFTAARKWLGENSDIETPAMFRMFYDQITKLITPPSVAALVVLIGKYQYQAAFVADQEINLAAFIAEVMAEVQFK